MRLSNSLMAGVAAIAMILYSTLFVSHNVILNLMP